jgi:hypothetical protein
MQSGDPTKLHRKSGFGLHQLRNRSTAAVLNFPICSSTSTPKLSYPVTAVGPCWHFWPGLLAFAGDRLILQDDEALTPTRSGHNRGRQNACAGLPLMLSQLIHLGSG